MAEIKNQSLNTFLANWEVRFTETFMAMRSRLPKESDTIAYSQSLEKLRDTKVGIIYAADRAHEEGKEEGRKEGRKEGSECKAIEIALRAKELGLLSLEDISALTGLSIDVIKKI